VHSNSEGAKGKLREHNFNRRQREDSETHGGTRRRSVGSTPAWSRARARARARLRGGYPVALPLDYRDGFRIRVGPPDSAQDGQENCEDRGFDGDAFDVSTDTEHIVHVFGAR
jgi:hypothetical protein